MNHSLISSSQREEFLRQLVYLDENKFAILDRAAMESPAEREEVRTMIMLYQERVQRILSGTGDDLKRSVVLIGSRVSLRIGQETLKEAYRIVIPDKADLEEYCISVWSPMGRGLLLAEPGDTVTIHTPLGSDQVLVLNNVYDHSQMPDRDITV